MFCVVATVTVIQVTDIDMTMTVVYSLVPLIGLAIVMSVLFWLWSRYGRCKKHVDRSLVTEALLSAEAALETVPHPPELTGEVIARGRFGTVQVGRHEGEEVAVKMLVACHKDSWISWQRECDIYTQPGLASHPHILHFIAALFYNDHLWVITQLQRQGCLADFLKVSPILYLFYM